MDNDNNALLNIICLPWNAHVYPLACIVCVYVTIYILLHVYTPVIEYYIGNYTITCAVELTAYDNNNNK